MEENVLQKARCHALNPNVKNGVRKNVLVFLNVQGNKRVVRPPVSVLNLVKRTRF